MYDKGKIWFGLLVLASAILLPACTREPTIEKPTEPQPVSVTADPEVVNRPIETMTRGYISSTNCRQCHAHHFDTWHASHHRTMTQLPTQESVIADFDNKIIVHSGREFRFFHEADNYFMEIRNADRSAENGTQQSRIFKIVLMTGAHHQQAFWGETSRGRALAKIPFIWINKEQRWVPYGSIFFLQSKGLSMHGGAWNSNCIKCHVVGAQPRLDQDNIFDTHVAEFGISCEA